LNNFLIKWCDKKKKLSYFHHLQNRNLKEVGEALILTTGESADFDFLATSV